MKRVIIRPKRFIFSLIFFSFFITFFAASGHNTAAKPEIKEVKSGTKRIDLVIKKSYLITLDSPSNRVSVVDPAIADLQVIDPKQIMLSGLTVGNTNMVIWTEDGKTQMYDVYVKLDIAKIKETLKKILPNEAIDVVAIEQGIALQGEVHKIESVEEAMDIAKSFCPKVMNLLKVPGLHQVLLKVKVAEVARSFQEQAGINFYLTEQDMIAGSRLGGLMSGSFGDTSKNDVTFSDAVTLFFGLERGKVNGFIQALKSKGLVHILAEPNLIARSGESAEFLAGGEYPIPIVQGGNSNSITIEYKQFGVKLNFTPTVIGSDTIQLDIAPEVSDLDFTRGVKVGGFSIPGLVTRRAHTNVQLKDGQTFAIAGLISQSRQKNNRKVPLVGDIPVLGGLFKGSEMEGKDTELLILVTPNLISPLEQSLENYSTPIDDSNTQQKKLLQQQSAPIPKSSVESKSMPLESAKVDAKASNSQSTSVSQKTKSAGSGSKTMAPEKKSINTQTESGAPTLKPKDSQSTKSTPNLKETVPKDKTVKSKSKSSNNPGKSVESSAKSNRSPGESGNPDSHSTLPSESVTSGSNSIIPQSSPAAPVAETVNSLNSDHYAESKTKKSLSPNINSSNSFYSNPSIQPSSIVSEFKAARSKTHGKNNSKS